MKYDAHGALRANALEAAVTPGKTAPIVKQIPIFEGYFISVSKARRPQSLYFPWFGTPNFKAFALMARSSAHRTVW